MPGRHYRSLYIVILPPELFQSSPPPAQLLPEFFCTGFLDGLSYFFNLFTLLFFDVILMQRGHAAQTVYDRFNLLYNEINVLFCDLLT